MASLGEMISNIAHQWRQPLNAISTAASGMKLQSELGILEKETITKISNVIQNWNYDVYGKCTGAKIVELTNISKKTVLLHLKHYRDIIKEINKEKKRSTSMNIVNLIQRTTLFLNEKNTSTEKEHIQRTTPFLNDINYKDMGTVEDTSTYDSYKLTNVDEIKRFVKDNNLQWKYSTPKDFVLNRSYMSKSNFDKAKILLLSI
jgi:hypothetical protein